VKLPGETKGFRIPTPVSGVDILPTVADVLGLPVPDAVDGYSLRAPPIPARSLIVESSEGDGTWMRGLVRGTTKLIVREQNFELYDLSSDPDELIDLLPREMLLAEELSRRLNESVGGSRVAPGGDALDEKEAARLRTLGYLE
jgi:arylsulfatase A-like enzyme